MVISDANTSIWHHCDNITNIRRRKTFTNTILELNFPLSSLCHVCNALLSLWKYVWLIVIVQINYFRFWLHLNIWRPEESGRHGLLARYVKLGGCACAGNAGNVFLATTGQRSQHASRYVRSHILVDVFLSIDPTVDIIHFISIQSIYTDRLFSNSTSLTYTHSIISYIGSCRIVHDNIMRSCGDVLITHFPVWH